MLAQDLEESVGLDFLFKWRGAVEASPELIIVAIDEFTEDALGQPVNRAHHASLIERLTDGGATVIALDFFLPI